MKKTQSYFAYFFTLFSSLSVAVMVVLDAILFPSETDAEPWYYFLFFSLFSIMTVVGWGLSFRLRNPNTTSKKEAIFSYCAMAAGAVLMVFPFIDEVKYLTAGACGLGLVTVGIASFLSTELGLIAKTKSGWENSVYMAFPNAIRPDVQTVVRWIKRNRQVKPNCVLLPAAYYRDFGEVFVPRRVNFRDLDASGACGGNAGMIYWCLQTRNSDGKIREKYVRKILESDYPSWTIPYIIEASTDYVIEIVAALYEMVKGKPNDEIRTFYKSDLKRFRRDYSKMLSYWNAYYRQRYPRYEDYPGYKLFTECYGFKKNYYREAGQESISSGQLNQLWDLYSADQLKGTVFFLCDYYSGVMGEGHSGFFFNTENGRNNHPLRDYVTHLKEILPEDLYLNLVSAVNSFQTRRETAVCKKADACFFEHQDEYTELLRECAANIALNGDAGGGIENCRAKHRSD